MMKEFGMTYSELRDEMGKHSRKYGQLYRVMMEFREEELSQSGQMPLDNNIDERHESIAAKARMNESTSYIAMMKKAAKGKV